MLPTQTKGKTFLVMNDKLCENDSLKASRVKNDCSVVVGGMAAAAVTLLKPSPVQNARHGID